jgi:transposase
MEGPSQIFDLNPIENLWRVQKIGVKKRQPKILKEVEQSLSKFLYLSVAGLVALYSA